MDALANDIPPEVCPRDRRPVFLQEWWLEAAREALPRPYREARVVRNGEVVGYLGFTLKSNRIGIRTWEPFDWCRVNEPILSQRLNAGEKAIVLRELFRQLPRAYSFEFVCGPSAQDLTLITEIATEAGFKQRRETIFWQEPELSLNIRNRVTRKYWQSIKKAAADLAFVDLSPEAFVRLYGANLEAAGRRPYSDPNVAKQMLTAAMRRQEPQGRILAARKKSASADSTFVDAAIACVWDNERYYSWMTTCSRFGGEFQEKAHTHAVKYLLVQAILDAGERGLIFDTDSGDSEGAVKQFLYLRIENKAERLIFMRHKFSLRMYNWLKEHMAPQAQRPPAKPIGKSSQLAQFLAHFLLRIRKRLSLPSGRQA